MEQFRYGLSNDVKDLLLTFPEEPKSSTEAIKRVVRCDNHLFERRTEHQFQMPRARSEPTYTSVVAKPFPRESFNTSPTNTPTPMEIDTTRRRGPLMEEVNQQPLMSLLRWTGAYCSELAPSTKKAGKSNNRYY